MSKSHPVEVISYSGRRQAERPLSFVWQDHVHRVERLEREWLGPRGPHFLVRSGDGSRYHLAFRETQDLWLLLPLEDG
ncbi:MAG: hypothetical protein ACE5NC_00690 [Anaerolineae bacterium]